MRSEEKHRPRFISEFSSKLLADTEFRYFIISFVFLIVDYSDANQETIANSLENVIKAKYYFFHGKKFCRYFRYASRA